MLIKRGTVIRPSEITCETNYLNRRQFINTAAITGSGLLLSAGCSDAKSPDLSLDAELTPNPLEDITAYNNFYEFGLGKGDPAKYSGSFQPMPWSVMIDGEAEITGTFDYEDIIGPHTIEERVYRLRCVEAWSMIVPWNGISLGEFLKRFRPTSKARYVASP